MRSCQSQKNKDIPGSITDDKIALDFSSLQNQEAAQDSSTSNSQTPHCASPTLMKRSSRVTGFNLTKRNQDAEINQLENVKSDPPSSDSNQTAKTSNDEDNDEQSPTGLAGMSFKDMMMSKKRIVLRSSNPSLKKQVSKSQSPQKDKKKEDLRPVIPKIKEIKFRKTGFEKAFETIQGSQEHESKSQKSLGSKTDILTQQKPKTLDFSEQVLPSMQTIYEDDSHQDSMKLSSIVMKTVSREKSDVDARLSLVTCFEKSPSPPRRKRIQSEILRNLTLFMPNQNHIGKSERPDGATSPSKLSPIELKQYLNNKINESELIKERLPARSLTNVSSLQPFKCGTSPDSKTDSSVKILKTQSDCCGYNEITSPFRAEEDPAADTISNEILEFSRTVELHTRSRSRSKRKTIPCSQYTEAEFAKDASIAKTAMKNLAKFDNDDTIAKKCNDDGFFTTQLSIQNFETADSLTENKDSSI